MGAIRKSSLFAVAFLVMFAGSARAQEILTVKVPFPFVVGSEHFPAGHYDILAPGDNQGVVSIRGTDNRSAAFALTISADGGDPAGDQPALLFKRYENGYRLSQIWESSTEGLVLSGFSAAHKTAREEAPAGSSEESTYVATASRK